MQKGLSSRTLLGITAISALAISGLPDIPFGQVRTGVILADQGPREVAITPFMADETTENTRILLDGNRITHKSLVKIYRDSEGRMRREEYRINPQGVPEDWPWFIYIDDPIAGVFYSLDPRTRTAHKVERHRAIDFPPAKTIAPTPHQPNVQAQPEEARREFRREPLGSQVIEGFNTEGTRITEVIPAGAQGNEQPLEIVTERWVSPELHIPLLTKRDDPFAGQTVTQVSNIRLEEPPPDVFQVPADYAVEGIVQPASVSPPQPAKE